MKSGRTLHRGLEVGYAGGFAFRPSNDGFYYCHEIQPSMEEHTIRLHLFAEPHAEKVVFRAPRTRESRLILTADALHLGALWLHECRSEIVSDFFIAPLERVSKWIRIPPHQGRSYHPFLHQGRIFALRIAEHGGLAVTELASDGRETHTIIPSKAPAIRQIAIAKDRIYANHLDRGIPAISIWSLNGEYLGVIDVPKAGSITLLANHGQRESNVFYTYESFDQPLTTFEYDSERNQSRVWHQRTLRTSQNPSIARHTSFQSKGGWEIPLTLVSPKNLSPARPAPTILTSYGGFGAPMSPQFSVLGATMRELGGIFAIAHVRGGGELGQPWHEAGRKQNRQNAIDDFIAAAEWLCAHGITTPKQLAIFGGSNAGLLVAAAMTQRPRLFGAVLCIAPLLDMVRYERFDLALRWRDEYGTAENTDDFRALYAYSPYHHVDEDIDYPPVMCVSGDKDDRCNPAHVRKMAARLQSRSAQRSPVIVDYSEQRGHVPALPLSTRVEALARRIAFLCKELTISLPAGGDHEEICC
jgi:prolyl oligopeptidase